jgi:N-acyl homoserine lactone hydrolase
MTNETEVAIRENLISEVQANPEQNTFTVQTRSGTLRIHIIQTGRVAGFEKIMKRLTLLSILGPRKPFSIPVLCFIIEHPEGVFAIDTGLTVQVNPTDRLTRFIGPLPVIKRDEEIDVQLQRCGIKIVDIQRVVLTHLDWDHASGVRHFPNAEIFVYQDEYKYATSFIGKKRMKPEIWPSWFDPTLYVLDDDPYGPFMSSKPLTESGDVRLVPLPGHTPGQVGLVIETEEKKLFFPADHITRQDWFEEAISTDSLYRMGYAFFPKAALETSHKIIRFVKENPVVLLPSHDHETPARLERMEVIKL